MPTSVLRSLTWAGCAAALALFSSLAPAADAVPGFGSHTPVPNASERPRADVVYRVVFDLSAAPPRPEAVHPGLDRVARLANLLGAEAVTKERQKIVAIVHGEATDSVANDSAYRSRHAGQSNPNAPLVQALLAAGVSVRICGQAMNSHKLSAKDLLPGVQVDLAALTTVVNLQLDGYALVKD